MSKMKPNRITVFIDMDGVLADFDTFIMETTGRPFDSFPDSASAWASIDAHKDIYARLPMMVDATQLVDGIFKLRDKFDQKFDVAVLTAIPKIGRIPDARAHKREWIKKYFRELYDNFNIGPHAEHKQYHCRVGDVLIDDVQRNIDQWTSKGGFGITHTSAATSLERLENFLGGYFAKDQISPFHLSLQDQERIGEFVDDHVASSGHEIGEYSTYTFKTEGKKNLNVVVTTIALLDHGKRSSVFIKEV